MKARSFVLIAITFALAACGSSSGGSSSTSSGGGVGGETDMMSLSYSKSVEGEKQQ